MMLINKIIKSTNIYIQKTSKQNRKKIGQFFTSKETAMYMASLIDLDKINESVKILDPGCGSLILCSAVIQHLLEEKNNINKIELTLYENDNSIMNLVEDNIKLIKQYVKELDIDIRIKLIKENYILHNTKNWKKPTNYFDIIISNPPYKKIRKNDKEAQALKEIVYGQPNLYYLFMAISVQLIKEGGDFIFIIPRSWTSGLYFTKFREFLFNNMKTKKIHLFHSRNDVFDNENVLQETMIYYAQKGLPELDDLIEINTTMANGDLELINQMFIENESCIQNFNGRFMFLPVKNEEIEILNHLNHFNRTLFESGYKLKTGPIVTFRNIEFLSKNGNDYPLLYASHFHDGEILFPNKIENLQYLRKDSKVSFLKNKNYLLLKRLTSKEENRRLQPSLYFKKNIPNSEFLNFENHINYLTKINGELSREELFGLFVIFNSTYWDMYYRILNGSTQVNANEINNMPIPDENLIIELGKRFNEKNKSVEHCDYLIREVLFL